MRYVKSVYLQLAINAIVSKQFTVSGCRLTYFGKVMEGHAEKSPESCRRHESVPGLPERSNDVIVCGDVTSAKEHVIFFGGDVQDYPEKMSSHRDNKRYLKWNLENTAMLLLRKFKHSAIFVVKPTRMHLNTFSVYSNFVESCNDFGSPTHQHSTQSWTHLETLYKNALSLEREYERATCSLSTVTVDKEQVPLSDSCAKNANKSEIPLKLIGFSKGCVVLNQLIYDLAIAQTHVERENFIGRIQEFCWLDGGHSGGWNTWICDTDILQNFSELGKKIIVHVTPYQVKDPMRAWVGKEEKKFVSKLKKFGADITETLHFDDMPASIENHFGVLEEF